MNYRIEYREDASLSHAEDEELRRLLLACFPHEPLFRERRYLRERPPHRWLVRGEGIIAHCAVHEKTLGSGAGDIRVGGVAEVCVDAAHRRKGLVREMLDAVHSWLAENGTPFAVQVQVKV